MQTEKQFIINETGTTTGERYSGTFRVKTLLTKREEIAADIRRRSILGPNPETALTVISNDAYVLGQLSVRIIDAPSWWDKSDGGLDLTDDNVIQKVYEETIKAEIEYREEVAKAAEKVTKILKKTAGKSPDNAAPEEE